MSIEKNMNTRIQHKHDIEANWKKAVNFIPKQGEIIIYDIDENYNYPRIKVGDGDNYIEDLPFANDHEYSWNDLNDKPFGEIVTGSDTFTWDGNTDGLEHVTLPLGDGFSSLTCYKISDNFFTIDDCQNGIVLKLDDRVINFGQEHIISIDGLVATEGLFSVSKVGTYDGVTFESTGIYTFIQESFSLTVPNYTGFITIETKILDEKYLPDIIARIDNIPQSDWNQNDETALDYIKNRPFESVDLVFDGVYEGKEFVGNVTNVTENGVIKKWDTFVKLSDLTPAKEDVIGGKIEFCEFISLLFKLQEETITKKSFCDLSVFGVEKKYGYGIRSATLAAIPELSESAYYPFIAVINDEFEWNGQKVTKGIWAISSGKTYDSETYPTKFSFAKKIDPKYLPEGGVGYSYQQKCQSTYTFDGDLNNCIEYICADETASQIPYFVKISNNIPEIISGTISIYEGGSTTTVEITEDDLIDYSQEGMNAYTIGDFVLVAREDLISGNLSLTAGTWTTLFVDPESGEAIRYGSEISFFGTESKVSKIDSKFLYKPDWNQNDKNAPDYIENKPFYHEEDFKTIIPMDEYDFVYSASLGNVITANFDNFDSKLTEGNSYVLYLDDKEYICQAKPFNITDEVEIIYIGDHPYDSSLSENISCSLMYSEYEGQKELECWIPFTYIDESSKNQKHTLEVREIINNIKRIDEEFLPEIYSDMIVDGPFGTNKEIIYDGYINNVTHSIGNICVYRAPFALKENEIYDVIFDGKIYRNLITVRNDPNDSNLISFGASDALSITKDAIPFYMESDALSINMWDIFTIGTPHSIKILKHDGVKQIDEKFIPDTIARVAGVKQIIQESLENLNPKYLPEGGFGYTESIEDIVWDGDTTGKQTLGNEEFVIKISDVPVDLTKVEKITMAGDIFDGSTTVTIFDKNVFTINDLGFASVIVRGSINLVYSVSEDTYQEEIGTIQKGTYFRISSLGYVSRVEFTETINKINEKYIPDTLAKITYVDEQLAAKANSVHNHDDIYYTKEELDAMEFITVADIDAICGIKTLISFIINSTEYQAEEGMTWGEWFNSEYNTDIGGGLISSADGYISDEDIIKDGGKYHFSEDL